MYTVSHFIDYIGYAKGGAESNVLGLCRHNNNPHFQFEVITSHFPFFPPDFRGLKAEIKTTVGLHYIREASFFFKGFISDLLYRIPGLVYKHNVQKFLPQNGIIHCHNLDILKLLRHRQIRPPVVLTVYNPLPRRYYSDVKWIDCVIVRSNSVLAELITEFPGLKDKFVYIPPGCEFSFYQQTGDRFAIPENLASKKIVKLLMVGRLRPFKNVEGMIAALQILKREVCPEYTLTVVGSGPRLGSLQRMAQKFGVSSRIRFAGSFPMDCMGQVYHNHDVVVVPSFYESFSQVSLEALVASRRLLISESMEEFRSKFPTIPTCDPHSPQDIAKKIIQVTRDSERHISAIDLKPYEWQDVIQQHYKVYRMLSTSP